MGGKAAPHRDVEAAAPTIQPPFPKRPNNPRCKFLEAIFLRFGPMVLPLVVQLPGACRLGDAVVGDSDAAGHGSDERTRAAVG